MFKFLKNTICYLIIAVVLQSALALPVLADEDEEGSIIPDIGGMASDAINTAAEAGSSALADAQELADAQARNEALERYESALDDLKNEKCIDIPATADEFSQFNYSPQGFSDVGKRITIIEEPINPRSFTVPDQNLESRICYRNVFTYKDALGNSRRKSVPELAKKCSENAAEILAGLSVDQIRSREVGFSCKKVQVLLSQGGTSTLSLYLAAIYRWAVSVVGLIAVAVIIVSGIAISASMGDSQAIEGAKKRIGQSLLGLALLFLSGLILYTVNPTFFTY